MVLLMLTYAIAIGRATFIEDMYDTPAAKIMVFNAVWFQMLNFILAINLLGGMFRYNVFRKEKIGQLMFHLSFILILVGAGITRYIGFEGVMIIKEGETQNRMFSSEPYLQFTFRQLDENSLTGVDSSGYKVQKWMSEPTQSHNDFEYTFDLKNNTQVTTSYNWYRTESVYDVFDGEGDGQEILLIKYGRSPRDTFYIKSGDVRIHRDGLLYAFNNYKYTEAIQFRSENKGEVKVKAPYDIEVLDQAKAKNFKGKGMPPRDTLMRDEWHKLRPRVVHFVNGSSFFYTSHFDDAKLGFRKQNQIEKEKKQGSAFLSVDVLYKGKRKTLLMEGKASLPTQFAEAVYEDLMVQVGFGPILRKTPFHVGCEDFRLKKYAGSDMASSYEADLRIMDTLRDEFYSASVYMNNVLDHGGYRFFQSSYDFSPEAMRNNEGPDITVLSVNHDYWGTFFTYIGYILMAIGFIWSMFLKQSRFRYLTRQVKRMHEKRIKSGLKTILILLGLGLSGHGVAQHEDNQAESIGIDSTIQTDFDKDYVKKAKRILIQTPEGRISPLQSHGLDVLYKVYKKRAYNGLSATEVYLSMLAKPYPWYLEPIISVKNPELGALLGLEIGEKYASVSDFLNPELFAKQRLQIRWDIKERYEESKRTMDSRKTSFDKDIIKAIDQYQVMLGVLNGSLFRVFPVSDTKNNTWIALSEMMAYQGAEANEILKTQDLMFKGMLAGIMDGNWQKANDGLDALLSYQQQYGGDTLPSESKVNLEILYNDINIFFILLIVYTSFGLIMLVVLLTGIFFKPHAVGKVFLKIATYFMILLAGFHVFGLGLRWYVTGHAPWSNGYEALVFIAFVTVLAGIIFSRFTRFTLAAAPILAGLILGIAHASNVDPQLTNLVPVLKSYWLVIHVAIITGSYGFLGLGAILSLISISIYALRGTKNKEVISDAISELTYVAEITMTVGLYMAAIGTFLGGVWANESWGRYWGWDAKETWALVIVISYSLILHTRFIPFLKKKLTFNLLGFWAYGTVIMTYFGVNYYLSKGLHSYARGDKGSLPDWAIYTIIILALISVLAVIQNKRYIKLHPQKKKNE